jgi:hypothetical protein
MRIRGKEVEEAEMAMGGMGLSSDMSRTDVEMARAFNGGKIKTEKRATDNTTRMSIESLCEEVFVPAFTQKESCIKGPS